MPTSILTVGTITPPSEVRNGVEKFKVILCRPGSSVKAFHCPIGTTLEELANIAEFTVLNQIVTVSNNNREPGSESLKREGTFALQANDIVFVTPKPKNA